MRSVLRAGLCFGVCLGLSACSPAASESDLDDASLRSDGIIGGTKDTGDPAVVLMKASQGNTGWWCTGTVIATRLVLTAAHCVEDAGQGTKIKVMFGTEESKAKPSDYIDVKEWHHDPKYMATNNIAAGHDAAVLILAQDAPVTPLPINRKALTQAMVGSPVHVVGFGNDNGWAGTGSGIKRHIFTKVAGLEQGVVNIGKPGQTTCQGDSGGPSFMTIDGVDVIVGITSYGLQGCVDYGSSTRVDLAASWIDPYISANGGDPGGGDDPGGDVCKPACDGRNCGDDGCGSSCGTCDSGDVCNSQGVCEGSAPPPPPPGGNGQESEPNDDPNESNPLSGGVSGTIGSVADHDWYTWDVGAGATYTIKLSTSHEYVMTLYKVVSGGYLYEITSAFDVIEKTTPNGGEYYMEIWGGNGDYSASDPYDLTVSIH